MSLWRVTRQMRVFNRVPSLLALVNGASERAPAEVVREAITCTVEGHLPEPDRTLLSYALNIGGRYNAERLANRWAEMTTYCAEADLPVLVPLTRQKSQLALRHTAAIELLRSELVGRADNPCTSPGPPPAIMDTQLLGEAAQAAQLLAHTLRAVVTSSSPLGQDRSARTVMQLLPSLDGIIRYEVPQVRRVELAAYLALLFQAETDTERARRKPWTQLVQELLLLTAPPVDTQRFKHDQWFVDDDPGATTVADRPLRERRHFPASASQLLRKLRLWKSLSSSERMPERAWLVSIDSDTKGAAAVFANLERQGSWASLSRDPNIDESHRRLLRGTLDRL